MRVVFIGYPHNRIYAWLCSKGHDVCYIEGNDSEEYVSKIHAFQPDFVILHGCHFILEDSLVSQYSDRIINCHGSYLPYNRGAFPNIWSHLNGTVSGCTIHLINSEIDSGVILFQDKLVFDESFTLSQSYWLIRMLLEDLFVQNFETFINNKTRSQGKKVAASKVYYRKDLKKLGISDISEVLHLSIKEFKTKYTPIYKSQFSG
jgi:methionyl-tRNA formyltransferase